MCSWMVVILLLWHHSKIKMELICSFKNIHFLVIYIPSNFKLTSEGRNVIEIKYFEICQFSVKIILSNQSL